MDFGSVNWLAVIVCVVVSMIIGSVWYHPKVFFTMWWKGIGKTGRPGDTGGNQGMMWGLTVLASVVEAVAMAFMVKTVGGLMPGGVTWLTGLSTGFMLWLGFVAPTNLVNKLFAGFGLKVWAIEVGNHLLNLLAFGAILGAWH
jgi:hypothetical protein